MLFACANFTLLKVKAAVEVAVVVVAVLGLEAVEVVQKVAVEVVAMVVVVGKAAAAVAMEKLKLEYGSLKLLAEVNTTGEVACHHTSPRPIQVLQTIPIGNGV